MWGTIDSEASRRGAWRPSGLVPPKQGVQHLAVLELPQPRGDAESIGPTRCCKWIITQSN